MDHINAIQKEFSTVDHVRSSQNNDVWFVKDRRLKKNNK